MPCIIILSRRRRFHNSRLCMPPLQITPQSSACVIKPEIKEYTDNAGKPRRYWRNQEFPEFSSTSCNLLVLTSVFPWHHLHLPYPGKCLLEPLSPRTNIEQHTRCRKVIRVPFPELSNASLPVCFGIYYACCKGLHRLCQASRS